MTTNTADDARFRGPQIAGMAGSILLGLIAAAVLYGAWDYYCDLRVNAAETSVRLLHHRDPYGTDAGPISAGLGLCFGVTLLLSLGALVPLRNKPYAALFAFAPSGLMVSLACAAFAIEAYRRGDHSTMNAHWLTGTEGEITAAADGAREGVMWMSSSCSGACCCLGVVPLLVTAAVLMHRSRRTEG
jgi:hypothetical protein